jgi:hypothetical protein
MGSDQGSPGGRCRVEEGLRQKVEGDWALRICAGLDAAVPSSTSAACVDWLVGRSWSLAVSRRSGRVRVCAGKPGIGKGRRAFVFPWINGR